MSSIRSIAILTLSAALVTVVVAEVSGSGSTTRYWDCCKGSCSWTGKAVSQTQRSRKSPYDTETNDIVPSI